MAIVYPDETMEDDGDELGCQKPCDPDVGCPECSEYWQRMVREGFWDRANHRWTNKGWREITK